MCMCTTQCLQSYCIRFNICFMFCFMCMSSQYAVWSCRMSAILLLHCTGVILDASFSENFYGLRRVPCKHTVPGEPVAAAAAASAADESALADTQIVGDKVQHLTRRDRRLSLLFLVSRHVVLSNPWYKT